MYVEDFLFIFFLQCTSKYIWKWKTVHNCNYIQFFLLKKKKQKYIFFLDNETINSKTIIYCCYKGLINS